ncbi:type I-F CRISPR-associated endonuclease Cas1f [Acinetobacter rathckeae]|uniref:type I-F CRISPR-associated endonuclease Cas1f n=1 Tax=Acinetobacter rathckeae TaxID=2605272 RepID=UPI0018A3382C|nr:type I-F CRISPR-associated endonuclease Cas1f [Acinetobacter rathckeae]MBF7689130.1 type I-F CRISPR-associated endonuclease Cas1 [Acinetobacter rathckeae]MBF7695428.1 type I-F CRISPR-associated endonuclease Cas1 [Acinetobacter rathckeae]
MSDLRQQRSRALMLSKRACVFYLERVRVVLKDDRIVYLTDNLQPIEHFYNIPEKNTAFLLLGKGSSLTDAAARRLAESNVMVGFCGSGGSPLFSALDLTFLAPQSEYRPTEYMQIWMKAWLNDDARLLMAKILLTERIYIVEKFWKKNQSLIQYGIVLNSQTIQRFQQDIENASNQTELLAAEGRWAKALYKTLARGFNFEFSRDEGKQSHDSIQDIANNYLDHGNYIAYGYAAVTLHGMGISFALPMLHGKTRRGGLVFDIADLVKDALVMPQAFVSAQLGQNQKEFRMQLIETCQDNDVLDYMFGFISELCNKVK